MSKTGDIMRDPEKGIQAFEQYQTTKGGPLSGAHLAFAYLPLVNGAGKIDASQVQEIVQRHLDSEEDSLGNGKQLQYRILTDLLANEKESSGEYMLLPMQLNSNSEGETDMSALFNPSTPGNYITIAAMINRPFSRGHVHVKSSDPREDPEYDPRYVSHPLDLEILALHIQYLENIARSGPMTKILKNQGRRIPECRDLSDINSAKQVVVDRCFTSFHPCGTCAMMPWENGGVVSDRLVVHGTKYLRVVDASIFPTIPGGNIQAMVYACAERAADIIKEDWKLKGDFEKGLFVTTVDESRR